MIKDAIETHERRRGLRRVASILIKTLAGAMFLSFMLYVAFIFWANFLTDEAYRQGMYESGRTKVLISEFRHHFQGRVHYGARTLEQLREERIISEETYQFITDGSYRYVPFSSATPDDAFVLRLGIPFMGNVLHKSDLQGHNPTPHTVIPK